MENTAPGIIDRHTHWIKPNENQAEFSFSYMYNHNENKGHHHQFIGRNVEKQSPHPHPESENEPPIIITGILQSYRFSFVTRFDNASGTIISP